MSGGVLLVDDEREFVMALSERLQMRDISADVAFDGPQALDAVAATAPEVMVLDLRMPGMDGTEVLERVKREHPHVEVIVATAHGTEKDELIVRELGAFDYLPKPIDIDVLAEKIKQAAAKSRRSRRAEEDGADT